MTGQPVVAGSIDTRQTTATWAESDSWPYLAIDGPLEPIKRLGLSLTVSKIFNGEYDAMVDMTLNDL